MLAAATTPPLGELNGRPPPRPLKGATNITVQFPIPDGQTKAITVPRPESVSALHQAVGLAFGPELAGKDFVLSDLSRDVASDGDLAEVTGPLVVMFPGCRALAAPASETIRFPPHPKTLTMAGEFEYFTTKAGHSPLPYAIAELIDNALRAVKENGGGRSKSITVSIVTSPGDRDGVICVQDNGLGMGKRELNEWAVMNLSMEDRGRRPSEPPAERATQLGGGIRRFLTSDLSFFGVGSKNAAFYLGKAIRVTSRPRGSHYCHELCIAADDLEERYRNDPNTVYEAEMISRNPREHSTLNAEEAAFPAVPAWVQEEEEQEQEDGSFTRILISQINPGILRLLKAEDKGAMVCRHLAHLYHYYLHGVTGNRGENADPCEQGGEDSDAALPQVRVERVVGDRVAWSRLLREVDDDMETRFLRGQRAELVFQLTVEGKGIVEGILWYFPFEYDTETVPLEDGGDGEDDGDDGLGPMLTQRPPEEVAEAETFSQGGGMAAPIFETFWQGRLIPETTVASLPFIDNVRSRRTAKGRDELPDEAFGRLRGALFFGPSFRVTRNKLSFRDNLEELLVGALPSGRHPEKRFRSWLGGCHQNLDKCMRFESLAPAREQAEARSKASEQITLFERLVVGGRVVRRGDLVRLQRVPGATVGRVVHFAVNRAVKEEGSYANGSVIVQPLPADIHGEDARATAQLRRMYGPITEADAAALEGKERSRHPASLAVEPLVVAGMAGGAPREVAAGHELPASSATVSDGAGKSITKATMHGKSEPLEVVQTLYYMGPPGADVPTSQEMAAAAAAGRVSGDAAMDALALAAEEERAGAAGASPPKKRKGKGKGNAKGGGGKRRKGAARGAAADDEAEPVEDDGAGECAARPRGPLPPPGGEVVYTHKCVSAKKDGAFHFPPLAGGSLGRAGEYLLQYALDPAPPGAAVAARCRVRVLPGAPARAEFSDLPPEGLDLRLGQACRHAPSLLLRDAHGNVVPDVAHLVDSVRLEVRPAGSGGGEGGGEVEACCRLSGLADEDGPGRIRLRGLRLKGPTEGGEGPPEGGMRLFACEASGRSRAAQERQESVGSAAAEVELVAILPALAGAGGGTCDDIGEGGGDGDLDGGNAVGVGGGEIEAVAPLLLRPGLPHTIRLVPGHPFDPAPRSDDGAEGCTPEGEGARAGTPGLSMCESRITHSHAKAAELEGALAIESGREVPAFSVAVLDRWGNPTAPRPQAPPVPGGEPTQLTLSMVPATLSASQALADASFSVRASCAATRPHASDFPVAASGVAEVSGLVARASEDGRPDRVLTLSLVFEGSDGAELRAPPPRGGAGAAAAESAGPEDQEGSPAGGPAEGSSARLGVAEVAPLRLRVTVSASASPSRLVFCSGAAGGGGEALPCEERDGGGELVFHAAAALAGGELSLSLRLVDESGRPATSGLAGKFKVSWAKIPSMGGRPGQQAPSAEVALPPLQVPQSAGEPLLAYVQFKPEGGSGPVLESNLEVYAAPGEPAAWSVLLMDDGGTQGGGGGTASGALATGGRGGGAEVVCGRSFSIEIEPVDQYGNKCKLGRAEALALPVPAVVPEGEVRFSAADGSPEGEWHEGGSSQSERQGGGSEGSPAARGGRDRWAVFHLPKMVLLGRPGPVRLVARDAGGEGGRSSLTEDSLTVDMLAGLPSKLVVVEPAGKRAACGIRGVLPSLVVEALDAGDNPCPAADFEVSIQSSALPGQGGSGAACALSAVEGSNKQKLEGGRASFGAIKITAQAEGTYVLRVTCSSRKLAVLHGVLELQLSRPNCVQGVSFVEESVAAPMVAGEGGRALLVEVETEDGEPLDEEAARGGLAVVLKRGRKAHTRLGPPERVEGCPARWSFAAGEVSEAGELSATAEYTEQRAALLPTLSKAEATRRSTAARLKVEAAAPAALVLADGDGDAAATVTNCGGDESRLIAVPSAEVHLEDAFGNRCAVEDVAVGAAVRWAEGSDPPEGAALPTFVCHAGHGEEEEEEGVPLAPEGEGPSASLFTDAEGAAAFGRVSVSPGTGSAGGAGRGLGIELVFTARAAGLDGLELEPLVVPVVFEDDEARFASRQGMASRRGELARRVLDLEAEVGAHDEAAQRARAEVSFFQAAVARRLDEVARAHRDGGGSGGSAPAPGSLGEVEARLEELDAAAPATQAAAAADPGRRAKVGRAGRHGEVKTFARLFAPGREPDPKVVGVVAWVGTVEDDAVARVVSHFVSRRLTTLVVEDGTEAARLRREFQSGKEFCPDLLALDLVPKEVREAGRGKTHLMSPAPTPEGEEPPRWAAWHEELHAVATDEGADPSLNLVMPHIHVAEEQLPAALRSGCPEGFLGFAVNLVRPSLPGIRGTVWYNLLGSIMVFDTLQHATGYRALLVNAMGKAKKNGPRSFPIPTMISVDGGRLANNGVITGDQGKVPQLHQMDFVLGARGRAGRAAAAAPAMRAALEALAEAHRELEAARERCDEVEAGEGGAAGGRRAQLATLQQELAALDQELGQGGGDQEGGEEGGGKGGGRRMGRARARKGGSDEGPLGPPAPKRSRRS